MSWSNTNKWWSTAAVAVCAAAIAGGAYAVAAEKNQPKGDVYPLGYCVVTGQKLGSMGDPIVFQHEGREIRFCCNSCVERFQADPSTYLKKIDAAIIKQQLPHYPRRKCVVSGEKLGDGTKETVDLVYRNRLVRFHSRECIETFVKSPAKYLARLDKAVLARQGDTYPLDTCVVLGTQLGEMGRPIDYVTGNRLVRLCCEGCVGTFQKEPAKYLAKLDEAWKATGHSAHGEQEAHAAVDSHEGHGESGGNGSHEGHSGHGMHGSHHGNCKHGQPGGNSGGGSAHEH